MPVTPNDAPTPSPGGELTPDRVRELLMLTAGGLGIRLPDALETAQLCRAWLNVFELEQG